MTATCHWCEEPMDGRPCIGKPLKDTAVVEGVSYYRVPFNDPVIARPPPGGDDTANLQAAVDEASRSCHDCATPPGGLHHPGCDSERCPRCLGQAISCGCLWEGEEPDPDGGPERWPNDEAPQARRATETLTP